MPITPAALPVAGSRHVPGGWRGDTGFWLDPAILTLEAARTTGMGRLRRATTQVELPGCGLTYREFMATSARPPGGAPRRWTRLLVAAGAGLSACAGAATSFNDLPNPPQSAALITMVLLTVALTWHAQSVTEPHKKNYVQFRHGLASGRDWVPQCALTCLARGPAVSPRGQRRAA